MGMQTVKDRWLVEMQLIKNDPEEENTWIKDRTFRSHTKAAEHIDAIIDEWAMHGRESGLRYRIVHERTIREVV